jgi:DNA segregation ATPase FtsK/SpoIIIE-like protein
MPHLLIAGATGTGKSVSMNAMIMSILFKASPRDVRMIMIDPKMLELSTYEGIPHLLVPVVTDPKKAAAALANMVREMEDRYRLLHERGVRNVDSYNRLIAQAREAAGEAEREAAGDDEDGGEPATRNDATSARGGRHRHLPRIVVIIDELADLMMTVGREIEESITRLAQKARAAGIHLILATQRPSVDVIKRQEQPRYEMELLEGGDDDDGEGGDEEDLSDEMYDMAVRLVTEHRQASISWLQRRLRVGYNRAARMIERMEREGVVSSASGTKGREVIARRIDE